MKIKKLSMQGFKSFMDRLEISFPGGISGVVGPNGCGKSNIVDAIRWCMGEQSPKQLRGRLMEDVIFNGTGDQKPLGMAEVSIMFENGGGTFPPAFANDAEISVTRRLYRSGESEYLINSVPCRLRDIQEVFMDTGLGNKAYSIISQGQIGNILEQKPEETRVMLEEAAGITKYRKKVETSQRKIALTETNLQRVEDILGEVEAQMRSLKRQAAKASRYKAICEEIRELELKLYANSYEKLREESGIKMKSTEELVNQEISRSTALSQLHAKIEGLNIELEEMNKGLSGCIKDHLELKEGVHKKEAGLESITGEMKMYEELEARLKGEQEEFQRRLKELRNTKVNVQQKIENIKKRFQSLEDEISIKEKRVAGRRDSLKGIREEYEKIREQVNTNLNKVMGLNHDAGYIKKMLEQITDSRSRMEKELHEFKSRMKELIKVSDRKSRARQATAETLKEVEASIQKENKRSKALEEERQSIETDIKSAEADLNSKHSRLASLQSLTENYEGYKIGVRTIMKAKDLESNQRGRILGLVADVIHVDQKYEQAVEAVLADKLQYIIVESQKDGKLAVDYLKKRQKGRGSFIPIKEVQGILKGNGDRRGLSPLIERVSVSDKYRPLINVLLGNIYVVQDLNQAISQWQNNGKDASFVTLDGDIVDRRGVISGGKRTQGSEGPLARKREISQLKEKCIDCDKKLSRLKLNLQDLTEKTQKNKDKLDDLTEEKWTRQEEINEFDKILFRLAQEMEQLEKLSEKISKELEDKNRDESRHKDELQKVDKKLHQSKLIKNQEEKYFRQKEIELKASEEEFDHLREELLKGRADYEILKEEHRSMLREVERLDDFSKDSENRLEKIGQDISLSIERRDLCQKRKGVIHEELKIQYEKLATAEEEVNRANRERHDFYENIREEEKKAENLKKEIDALKDNINNAKMEHSEIQFKMNSLVDVVREKFNLNLADIYDRYVDADFAAGDVEKELNHKKDIREKMGEVNLTAIKEHEALQERYEFITKQREDLVKSIEALELAIKKINRTSLERFRKTFQEVDAKLKEIFPILFNGGTAALRLTDESKPLESGVLVEVQPPSKKLSHMGLLSGGEKALVAMALLFAIYMIKPSPFCLLDEVDAPLDEANIDRFNRLLEEIKRSSQIIMVTHSRRTMEITDRLYGVTMEKAGVSKVVSVDIEGMKNHSFENQPNREPTVH